MIRIAVLKLSFNVRHIFKNNKNLKILFYKVVLLHCHTSIPELSKKNDSLLINSLIISHTESLCFDCMDAFSFI